MRRHRARAPSQRQLRVGEELRHALARILGRGELRDPDLRDLPITVTEVRPSSDLRDAVVYVMPLGGGEGEAVAVALNRAAPYLQARLGREVTLKFTPRLRFEPDTTFDNADRIDALLRRGPAVESQGGGDGA